MLNRVACRRNTVLLILPPLLLAAQEARCALLGDVLKPFASVAETYDSNVFRVRDEGQLAALIGDTKMSDFITVFDVGTAVHYAISNQSLDLTLKRDFIRFAHYTQEDVDRDDVNGRLNLRVLDKFHGAIDGFYTREPEPRADFRSSELNVRTNTEVGVSAGYDMTAGLSLDVGYRRHGTDYSLAVYNPNEYDADFYSGTLSYKTPVGTQLFAKYQREDRKYREGVPTLLGTTVKRDNVADSFRVGAARNFSQRTAVSGYLGYVNRRYRELTDRDFSGIIAKAQMSYELTAKTALTFSGERDIYEETYSDRAYSVNNSFSLGAIYQATEKVKGSLEERLTWKDFEEIPGAVVAKRTDFIQELNAGVEWTPIKRLTAALNYQFSTRSSDEPGFDFTDHMVTASIGYKF